MGTTPIRATRRESTGLSWGSGRRSPFDAVEDGLWVAEQAVLVDTDDYPAAIDQAAVAFDVVAVLLVVLLVVGAFRTG